MPSIISAGTTTGTALSLTSDTSGELQIKTNNGSTTALTLTTGGAATFTAGSVSAPAITTSGDTNTGIFFPAADTIAFTEGGAESMRIDSSGNVGIGTSSPTAGGKLDVNGIAYFGTGDKVKIYSNNILQNAGTLDIGTIGSAACIFNTANTERMRIDSSGNLLVGTTSQYNSAKLSVNGSIASGTGWYTRAGTSGAIGSNLFNIQWTGSAALWIDGTNIGNIQVSSDYRIKRNIETQTVPALERVMALRPVTYQMADYGTLFRASDAIKEGFIAHEVQEVIPSGADGVKDAENQIQSLRVDAILAVAVKAIQELKSEVDALKAQLNQ